MPIVRILLTLALFFTGMTDFPDNRFVFLNVCFHLTEKLFREVYNGNSNDIQVFESNYIDSYC